MASSCTDTTEDTQGEIKQSFSYILDGWYAFGALGTRGRSGGTFQVTSPNLIGQELSNFKMNIFQAFLYWNLILKDQSRDTGSISFAEGSNSLTEVTGELIGCCGNTCWTPYGNALPDPYPDLPMINKVYRADVTSLVSPGTTSILAYNDKSFTVEGLPLDDLVTTSIGQTKYPGVAGSQGVALLLLYNWADGGRPSDFGIPREEDFWRIHIYDGCRLVRPPLNGKPASTAQIVHSLQCTGCPNAIWAVGDSQIEGSDMLYINGKPFYTQPPWPTDTPNEPTIATVGGAGEKQAFWQNMDPSMGAIWWQLREFAAPNHHGEVTHVPLTVDIISDSDCLSWFLYVYSSHCCNCHVKVHLVTDGAGLTISGNHAISLGEQTVDAVVLSDTCDCLDGHDPVFLNINDKGFKTIPRGGVNVRDGDTIDLHVNASRCQICMTIGPYCNQQQTAKSGLPTKITYHPIPGGG